ncbi:MAG TPA: hypothetical protein VE970_03550 [Pseudolabrys sp.]|nr:hypothetical protein [Pseudolabrys sp.]
MSYSGKLLHNGGNFSSALIPVLNVLRQKLLEQLQQRGGSGYVFSVPTKVLDYLTLPLHM